MLASADNASRADDVAIAKKDKMTVIAYVMSRYRTNKRLIEAAAGAFGIRPVFVWQPVPFYKYDLTTDLFGDRGEQLNPDHSTTDGYPTFASDVRTVPAGDNFIWCADIQEGRQEPLYVDAVHYTAVLAKMLAACIAAQLDERQLLAKSASATP
jgi:hypothetical protein